MPGVDFEDLAPSLLVWQTDLNLDLEPAWPHQGVIHHVPPKEGENFVNKYRVLGNCGPKVTAFFSQNMKIMDFLTPLGAPQMWSI